MTVSDFGGSVRDSVEPFGFSEEFLQAGTLDIGEDASVPPALRGEAPDFDDAVECRVAEHDLDVFWLVGIPVDQGQREPPAVLARGRRRVEEAERARLPVCPPGARIARG
jgi:hypothetical protein